MNQTIIERRMDEILAGPMPPMRAFMLELEGSGEEYVSLCRGRKTDFDGIEHFWLKARQKLEWWDRCGDGEGFGQKYESYAAFAASSVKLEEPLKYVNLSESEFYEFINLYPCFGQMGAPLSTILGLDELRAHYISGARADIGWSRIVAIAEFESEFVAFHWQTTA